MARVFVSYSHDSPEHQERVLGLAHRLLAAGHEVVLDRFVRQPSEGWPRWMMRGIRDAERIVCVCTKTYKRRFEGDETVVGFGVTWEGYLLTTELYFQRGHTTRIVPAYVDELADVPLVLQPHGPVTLEGVVERLGASAHPPRPATVVSDGVTEPVREHLDPTLGRVARARGRADAVVRRWPLAAFAGRIAARMDEDRRSEGPEAAEEVAHRWEDLADALERDEQEVSRRRDALLHRWQALQTRAGAVGAEDVAAAVDTGELDPDLLEAALDTASDEVEAIASRRRWRLGGLVTVLVMAALLLVAGAAWAYREPLAEGWRGKVCWTPGSEEVAPWTVDQVVATAGGACGWVLQGGEALLPEGAAGRVCSVPPASCPEGPWLVDPRGGVHPIDPHRAAEGTLVRGGSRFAVVGDERRLVALAGDLGVASVDPAACAEAWRAVPASAPERTAYVEALSDADGTDGSCEPTCDAPDFQTWLPEWWRAHCVEPPPPPDPGTRCYWHPDAWERNDKVSSSCSVEGSTLGDLPEGAETIAAELGLRCSSWRECR